MNAPTAALPAITAATFRERVMLAGGPVAVVFRAPGCPPCDRLADWLARKAARSAPGMAVVAIDVTAHPEAGLAQRVGKVPTLAVWHQGRELVRAEGPLPGRKLADWLARAVPAVPQRAMQVPKPRQRRRRRRPGGKAPRIHEQARPSPGGGA